MSENVTVTEVGSANERGWVNVTLSDGRTVEAKDAQIIARAREMVNQVAPATINEGRGKSAGRTFLNSFAGIGETKNGNAGSTGAATGAAQPRKQYNQDGARVGGVVARATELLIGSGADYSFPLTSAEQAKFEEQAQYLLTLSKRLEGE